MTKDIDLQRFESGTRRFEPTPPTSLSDALKTLGKNIRARPYRRSQAQKDAAKRIRDRTMGEANEG